MSHADEDAVMRAIRATPLDYLATTLKLHCVSFGEDYANFHAWLVASAEWERAEHPAVAAPAVAYRAPRAGRATIVAVADLPPGATIRFDDPSAKVAATGKVMGTAVGHPLGAATTHVWALVGPGDEPGSTCLWTAHAGEPIAPSTLDAAAWSGRTATAAEALAAGVQWVRCGR